MVRTSLLAGAVCCAAYFTLVWWLGRFGSSPVGYAAWGVAPLIILFLTATVTRGRLSDRLVIVLYVLAAIGAALLIRAWQNGYAIVLVTLPIALFLFVGIAVLTAVVLGRKTSTSR